jgi:hypothetical protein
VLGQEQHREDRPRRGDAAGHQGADREAAQERVVGRVLERLAEGGVAESTDLPGGRIGRADGLVRDGRQRARGLWPAWRR